MAIKLTEGQIENDFRNMLCDSKLSKAITGDIYFETMRPRDSKLEDIVIIFTEGDAGEIQTGKVTLNIFVPDIAPFVDGVRVKDKSRLDYLSSLAQEWIEGINPSMTRYKILNRATITTSSDDGIQQHFIAVHLWYKYF